MKRIVALLVLVWSVFSGGMAMATDKPAVMVLLAPGFEEGETVEILDVLRRGGFSVDAVSTAGEWVSGGHAITIRADKVLGRDNGDFLHYDMIVLPGGWDGVAHLQNDARVLELVRYYDRSGKFVAAMCAGPNVLAKAGILAGRKMTAYPGDRTEPFYRDATYLSDTVVRDGKLITSRGPGTALPFAFALVDALGGDSAVIKRSFLYDEMKAWPDGLANTPAK